jgi:hypothetical protein
MNEGGGAAEWVSFAAAEAIERPCRARVRPKIGQMLNGQRQIAWSIALWGGTRTGMETCYPKRPEISRQ